MTAPLTLQQAMKAIEQGLAADNKESGDFWQARKLLDAAGIYNDNLSGTRVLLELARAALLAVPSAPQEPPRYCTCSANGIENPAAHLKDCRMSVASAPQEPPHLGQEWVTKVTSSDEPELSVMGASAPQTVSTEALEIERRKLLRHAYRQGDIRISELCDLTILANEVLRLREAAPPQGWQPTMEMPPDGGSLNGPSRLGASRASDTGGEIGRQTELPDDYQWAHERVTSMCASALADAHVYGKKLLKGFGYPNETFGRAQDYRALSIVLSALPAPPSAPTPGEEKA